MNHESSVISEPISFKAVNLYSPDQVDHRDRKSNSKRAFETPILGSAYVSDSLCKICLQTYRKIAYPFGQEVHPHHFHQLPGFNHNAIGGIYFHRTWPATEDWQNAMATCSNNGFVIELQPLGIADGESCEAAIVQRIRAFCRQHPDSTTNVQELTAGVVVRRQGNLTPVCSLDTHPQFKNNAPFYFQISQQGEISFSY